ncbi:MAG: peptidoglycan DD-metalloendopeptidase family protein, partial [Bradyrhizobium sp.]
MGPVRKTAAAWLMTVIALSWISGAQAQLGSAFTVNPPGNIKDGYGIGSRDYTSYAPRIRFPIDATKTIATLNSQLRNPGGIFGGGGSQCAPSNYNEVWWDTYCERRDGTNRASLKCERRDIHQGVDIRGGTSQTCRELEAGKRDNVPVIAVSDGVIDRIGSYSVDLKTDDGFYRYLHLHMQTLQVSRGDHVRAGQLIGYMFNDFGGSSTTYHLHLEHWMAFAGKGFVPVPIYCDLVLAYERDTGKHQVISDGSHACSTAPAPGQPSAATADAISYWRYNGSGMKLLIRGAHRVFYYITPNPSLHDLIKPESVLFDGERTGNDYRGTAFSFSLNCPPTAYPVEGFVDDGGRTIILNGQRPVLGPECKPVRATPDRLVFLFQREEAGAPAIQAGEIQAGEPLQAAPGANKPATAAVDGLRPACTRPRCVDREYFLLAFADYYSKQDHRTLNRWQRDALNAILNVWDTTPELEGERRLAYILGTAYHESSHTIYPTRECSCMTDAGAVACAKRLYEAGKASAYFVRDGQTGQAYYGRGQTQLTLKDNFDRIGKNLGLGSRLVQAPDDALTLEVSAKNAVLGLYNGWYRQVDGKWLGLKHISFDSDDDWVHARDVLIAKGRAADDVASFSRSMLAMLRFIPLSEFQRKYDLNTAGSPAPSPVSPTMPAAVGAQPRPSPEPSARPAEPATAPPVPDAALLSQLQNASQDLDQSARDVAMRALDLSRKAAFLRGMLTATKPQSGGPGSQKRQSEYEPSETATSNSPVRADSTA